VAEYPHPAPTPQHQAQTPHSPQDNTSCPHEVQSLMNTPLIPKKKKKEKKRLDLKRKSKERKKEKGANGLRAQVPCRFSGVVALNPQHPSRHYHHPWRGVLPSRIHPQVPHHLKEERKEKKKKEKFKKKKYFLVVIEK
jgi:hypothetical protein